MASYSSKQEAKDALQKARNKLHAAKLKKNQKAYDKAMKECQDIQAVLDRWY